MNCSDEYHRILESGMPSCFGFGGAFDEKKLGDLIRSADIGGIQSSEQVWRRDRITH
jgi:hypothetical protein